MAALSSPSRARRPRREEVRERLIVAAITAFEQFGYAETTLSGVAEAAGFSRGAMYSNFSSKEELFLAALERNAAQRVDQILDLLDYNGRPDAAAGQFADRFDATRQWSLLFMEFCIQAHRRPELRDQLARTRRRMRAQVAHRLATRFGLGNAEDLDQTTAALMAVNNGLVIERLCDPDRIGHATLEAALNLPELSALRDTTSP